VKGIRGKGQAEMEGFSPTDFNRRDRLLKETEEPEGEIEDIKKRIPPHPVKDEIPQLLEEKEDKLKRKKSGFQNMR
jgi:uncharacterized protein YbaR (Trm112 family)